MTANVSFYVIAIDLTLRVKSHSLQYRKVTSPVEKVLIVDHHVIYIYLIIYIH